VWRVSAVDREGREVARFELASGELTIGRETDRQLVLPSASVSRRHAKIVVAGGQASVVDEGSANGVIVDGVRIQAQAPTAVGPDTRIEVAEFRISVEPMGPAAGAAPARHAPVAPAPTPAAAPMAAAPSAPPLRLIGEGGPYDGRFFDVRVGDSSVGRALDNDMVFDDPSLSRKHARLVRDAMGRVEVEDLGSSNGTFVNGRKVGRAPAGPGDVIQFGDLCFRVEGAEVSGTRAVDTSGGSGQMIALIVCGLFTLIVVGFAAYALMRKIPPVMASGKEPMAKMHEQAEQHFATGRTLFKERKYSDARSELEAALELDPANLEARRLKTLAIHAPDDDRAFAAATASLAIGDRKALENVVRLRGEMTEGSSARTQVTGKLSPAFERYGLGQCAHRAWAECAWAICRAYELQQSDAPVGAATADVLKKAEKKLAKDKTYTPCAAAPR
jgi:pSer/pThr/pTyr-binding forkhead associated (FHA) protein